MEIYLNSGKYLTIRRNVANNTKISFALNETSINEFNPPENWEYEYIPIKTAKNIFSNYLALDFFQNKDYDYRKAISYSLRRQDDYRDVYRLNKFSLGSDIHWKPFIFDLLGFNGQLLKEKYENDSKVEEIKKYINQLKNEFSVRSEDRDELIAEKNIVENEYNEIEQQIDRFNFYEQDKELIKEGIEEIEYKISDLNSQAYKLSYEINKLHLSVKNNFSFDIEKIKKVFNETSIYFPEQLENDYENLISFNEKLTTERNKLLKKTLKVKEEELNSLNKKLKQLNIDRENLLSYLTDTETFNKFKRKQKELVKVESSILKMQDKIDIIDILLSKESEIELINESNKELVDQLKSIYKSTQENTKYKRIRDTFSRFYKHIMNENAVLSWNLNTNNNVDFITPKIMSKDNQKKGTAKDEGNTYMKLLCVAFDLSIMTNYNKESYFRFVYHDDVLSQQDNGIKTRLLSLVDEIVNTYNIQYIFSAIRSDLPVNSSDKFIDFENENVVLRLHDNDPSGTLFGFDF